MRWIPGTLNIADALTKRNLATYELLNRTLAEGNLAVDVNSGYELYSATWK